ncbi:MAG: cyanophycin synthetase [Patescibacteria group bacterium]|jgi:dihydrofolate synthase/folylpolyglutamate synthase
MYAEYRRAYEAFLSLGNLSSLGSPHTKKLGGQSLKRTGDFLTNLGNPEKQLRFIHVAGTSGKGTVAFLLHQMIEKDRQTVGTFISPHTTSFLERFQVNDHLYDPALLTPCIVDLIKSYEEFLVDHDPLTFFELSVCLAIFAFARLEVTWCILETICGGRFDPTNVIPAPAVAIITNIDKDHTELLGASLAEIATQKAGIMKHKSTVLCGETRPTLKKIFTEEAILKSCALFFIPPPALPLIQPEFGFHMQHNAALAERAAHELDLSPQSITSVLTKFRELPCRFETMSQNPWIILDGAHNPAKIHATVERLRSEKRKIHVLFGCGASKDASQMLRELSKIATTITTTRYTNDYKKAANPFALLRLVPEPLRAGAYLDGHQALEAVKALTKKNEILLITGSLYLAGELRERFISEKQILEHKNSFLF